MSQSDTWKDKDSDIGMSVANFRGENIDIYSGHLSRIREDASKEEETYRGDYSQRQVYELIQNGADQLIEEGHGKVALLLTREALYCANEGEPINRAGVQAIMNSNLSSKSGNQIGRFGLGFKSVLAVTDNPVFLGRTGSFEFDKKRSIELMNGILRKYHGPREAIKQIFEEQTNEIFNEALNEQIEFDNLINILQDNSEAAVTVNRTDSNNPIEIVVRKAEFETNVDNLVDVIPTPILRLAWEVNPQIFFRKDDHLRKFSEWATTVIKLPFPTMTGSETVSALEEDFFNFRPEFLLFSQHVSVLELDDGHTLGLGDTGARKLTLKTISENDFEITDSQITSTETKNWKIFRKTHKFSDSEKQDLTTQIAERGSVEISWAVDEGARDRGEFWNFFPTNATSTLSGIVNAPWKVSNDRVTLIEGSANTGLIGSAAELVRDSLSFLVDSEDPGNVLDILPARGAEDHALSWEAGAIVDKVDEVVCQVGCIPDQDGVLQFPDSLRRTPNRPYVSARAAKKWAEFEDRPTNWFHPSVHENQNRYSTAIRMQEKRAHSAKTTAEESATVDEWLEALTEGITDPVKLVDASACAIRAAAQCMLEATADDITNWVRMSEVVLTEEGRLVPIAPDKVFIQSDNPYSNPLISVIDARVVSRPGVSEALEILGIRRVSSKDHLSALLTDSSLSNSTLENFGASKWDSFWHMCESLTESDLHTLAGSVSSRNFMQRRLKVKTSGGSYKAIDSSMYSGEIITSETDPELAVDLNFHGPSRFILDFLGVSDTPSEQDSFEEEPWFLSYAQAQKNQYLEWYEGEWLSQPGHENLSTPMATLLKIRLGNQLAPLQSISTMSIEGRVRITSHILRKIDLLEPVQVYHTTSKSYPEKKVDSPIVWLLEKYGLLDTEFHGPRPLGETLGTGLKDWSIITPVVVDLPEHIAASLRLPNRLEEMTESAAQELETKLPDLDGENLRLIGNYYLARLNTHPDPPERIFCCVGDSITKHITSEVVLVSEATEFRQARELEQPVILLAGGDNVSRLSAAWGLKSFGETVVEKVEAIHPGNSEPLKDIFPMITLALEGEYRNIEVVYCESLVVTKETGGKSLDSYPDDYYYDASQNIFYVIKVSEDPEDCESVLLDSVTKHLNLDTHIDDENRQALLDHRKSDQQRREENRIRDVEDLDEKILMLLDPEVIRSRVSDNLIEIVEAYYEEPVDDLGLVSIAKATFGVMILQKFEQELSEKGFNVPSSWSGSQSAIRFVTNLGFPTEYAGRRGARREPTFVVPGPKELPALHSYQQKVSKKLESFLENASDENPSVNLSGLLSLPTGSGKTRVTVQALTKFMRESDTSDKVILWVAPKDELCEQAVLTWEEVWRSIGSSDDLNIGRLWSSNEVNSTDGLHVVVATVSKLNAIIKRYQQEDYLEYDWLRKPDCVIIDEAHGETTNEFRRFRDWIGLGRRRTNHKTLYLGLTATAFRGRNEVQTNQLTDIFDKNRLDYGVFEGNDPIKQLQREGFLARAEHKELTGAEIYFDPTETKHFNTFGVMLGTAERRLANDIGRTINIIRHIKRAIKSSGKKSVLVFATTVPHARAISAVLQNDGINSASIDDTTDPSARRHYVEQFKAGEIQVLTNYAVVAEGFDAPSVDAVYIARPVYSPNSYQQMIGRGLRGPRNGGKESCLIVNVEDTVANFGNAVLAWHEFEHLWQPREEL